MKQFNIKRLAKERKYTLKIGAHPGIDPGPLVLQLDTLTTRPRDQGVRLLNNRTNRRDSASFVFVTKGNCGHRLITSELHLSVFGTVVQALISVQALVFDLA